MSDLYRVVPIESWPEHVELEERTSPFGRWKQGQGTVINWYDTTEKLERELDMLDAENVLLQMAVTDRDIRLDGRIRANARPSHPGVILTFDSKHGPLSYPCGAFDDWKANLRAIVLGLESLRRVDRYGIAPSGQQYTGWKRLPGAGETGATMTARKAAEVMVDLEGLGAEADDLLDAPLPHVLDAIRSTYLNAAKRVHPDRGGSTEDFQLLHRAKDVLQQHHGRSV